MKIRSKKNPNDPSSLTIRLSPDDYRALNERKDVVEKSGEIKITTQDIGVALLRAYAKGELMVDTDGTVTTSAQPRFVVRANENTVKIVKAFSGIVDKPADERTRIENMLVLNAEEATGIDIPK